MKLENLPGINIGIGFLLPFFKRIEKKSKQTALFTQNMKYSYKTSYLGYLDYLERCK